MSNNNQGDSAPNNPNDGDDNMQTNVYYINYSFTIPEPTGDGTGPSISDLAGLFGFRGEAGGGGGSEGTAGSTEGTGGIGGGIGVGGTGTGTGASTGASTGTGTGGIGNDRINTFLRNIVQQISGGAPTAAGTAGTGPEGTTTTTTTSGTTTTTTSTTTSTTTTQFPNIELAFTNIFQDNNNRPANDNDNPTTPNSNSTPANNQPEPNFWQHRFNEGTTNSNGDTVFYTSGTFPFDIRMPVFANLFEGNRKARASDRAISKLKNIDLNSLPESERSCPICFELYTELKEELPDPMDESDDPPVSIPGSVAEPTVLDDDPDVSIPDRHPDDDPAESIPNHARPDDDPPESTPESSRSDSKSHHVVEMPCNHRFGSSCIREWLSSSNTCPLCRTTIETQDDYLRSIGQQPESDNMGTNMFDVIFHVIPGLIGLLGQRDQNEEGENNNRNNATNESNDPNPNDRNSNQINESTTSATYTFTSSGPSSTPSATPQPPVFTSSGPSSTPSATPQPPPQPIPISPRRNPQFLRPLSTFLQSLQNRATPTDPQAPSGPRPTSRGPVRTTDRNSPIPSASFSPSISASATEQSNSRGGGTGGGVWIGPAGILSSWGPRWARRHHPYRSPASNSDDDAGESSRPNPATTTASRSASRNAEINDRRDLQCASAPLSLCINDTHDSEETDADSDPNRLVRLHCGHGYHIPCLRVGMRAHGDREIPNLVGGLDDSDGATRQVWCMRCRRYQDISNHD